MDAHEKARSWIDRRLAGEATEEENRLLDEHLAACAACRLFLERSISALRRLGELAVEVDPGLTVRVQTAVARRAAELGRERAQRRRMFLGLLAALLLTAAGSFAVWKVTPPAWTPAVLVFWMLPSLCAALGLLAPHLLVPASRNGEFAS